MNISFSDINDKVITFECEPEENVYMGTPVKMSRPGVVTACNDGDTLIGVAVNVRNGYAAVQISGYIEMPTDDFFNVGYTRICAAGDHKVKMDSTGREYLVVNVEKGIVGFML